MEDNNKNNKMRKRSVRRTSLDVLKSPAHSDLFFFVNIPGHLLAIICKGEVGDEDSLYLIFIFLV